MLGEHMNNDPIPALVADIFEIAGLFRCSGEAIARQSGQTQARWQVLTVLSEQPQTVAQTARRLGTSRQNIQRVVNELTQQGILNLNPNPNHRTSPLFSVSPSGQTVLDRIMENARIVHKKQIRTLSDSDINELRQFLQTLIVDLKEHASAKPETQ
jgi:DNA-binding MarR family transcriptional regulator